MPRAAHGKAVRCTLPGKCLLMQARQPLAGLIAQKGPAHRINSAHRPHIYLMLLPLLSLYCFCIFLRDAQAQDTILKFCFDIFLSHIVAYIEASLHCSCITLFADIFSFLILLVIVCSFCSGNCKIAVLKLYLDLVFLKSRQVNIQFISCVMLTDICQSSSNKFSPKILGINISHISFQNRTPEHLCFFVPFLCSSCNIALVVSTVKQ